jgi:hypothetical protein
MEIDAKEAPVKYFEFTCPGLTIGSTKTSEDPDGGGAFTNSVVLTTCGLIPAIFYNL